MYGVISSEYVPTQHNLVYHQTALEATSLAFQTWPFVYKLATSSFGYFWVLSSLKDRQQLTCPHL